MTKPNATQVGHEKLGSEEPTEIKPIPVNKRSNNSWFVEEMKIFHNMRFKFIRYCTVPLRCIPFDAPFIGSRTLIELFIIAATAAIGVYFCCVVVGGIGAGQVAGAVAATATAFGFKTNILSIVFGVSFERALYYHKYVSLLWIAFGIIHGVRTIEGISELTSSRSLVGLLILILAGVSILIYLFNRCFSKYCSFEVFYISHILLFIGMIVLGIMHGASQFLFVGIAWAIDLAIRYVLTLHRIKAKAILLPCGVIRLVFPKSFEYSAGQYCFVMVPQISRYQFHPFSLSSSPNQPDTMFHIRTLGDWTHRLHDYIAKTATEQGVSPENGIELDICVEGPVGNLALDLNDSSYKVILLVAGGIGITPTQSILNHLVYQYAVEEKVLRKCLMVWSVKDKAMADSIQVHEGLDLETDEGLNLPTSFQPDLVQMVGIEGRIEHMREVASAHATPRDNNGPSLKREGSASSTDVLECRSAIASNKNLDNATVFQGEFYLTCIRNEKDFIKANIDLTRQPYLSFGRPNLKNIVSRVAQYCSANIGERGNRVAVVACGPSAMISEVAGICTQKHHGITFDLHHEKFDF